MGNIIIKQAGENDMEEIKGIIKKAFDRPGNNESFNEWEFADKE